MMPYLLRGTSCEIEDYYQPHINMPSSARSASAWIALLFVSTSVEAFVGCKSNFIGRLNKLDTVPSSSISQLQMNLPGQVSKKVIVTGACRSSCYNFIFI